MCGLSLGSCGACWVSRGWCIHIWFGEHVLCCVPKSGDSFQLSCVRLCDGGGVIKYLHQFGVDGLMAILFGLSGDRYLWFPSPFWLLCLFGLW